LTSVILDNKDGEVRRFEPTACGRVTNAAKAPGDPAPAQKLRRDFCLEVAVVEKRWSGNGEPRLDEVLADPLVHLVMARDGVGLAELQAVIADAQRRLWSRLCCRIAA
jgi:hypothetical protein